MSLLDKLKKSKNIVALLSSPCLNSRTYNYLTELSLKDRDSLAEKILSQKDDDVLKVIINLARACFNAKGSEFMRNGSADFLATVLFKLAEKEKDTFAHTLQQSENKTMFPASYRPAPRLKQCFQVIKMLAKKYDDKLNSTDYSEKLAANILNKVLALPYLKSPTVEKAGHIQAIVQNNKQLNATFNQAITLDSDSENSELEQKVNSLWNTSFDSDSFQALIKKQITSTTWDLGFKLGFFTFGGTSVTIDNQNYRLPHRVAEIVKLIEKSGTDSSLNLEIIAAAQQALDEPRRGQKDGTRAFYQQVLDLKTSEQQKLALLING